MATRSERARHAAIMSLARDLGIDHHQAQRWCEAWERFAARHGVARGRYFWDSGRGWIDAQRSFENAAGSTERSSLVPPRVPLEPPVATARRVDQGP